MIMPLNLPQVDDKRYTDICIKHINKGLLKGVDCVLGGIDVALSNSNTMEFTKATLELRQYFPKGYYKNYIDELYRIRDILTSKMLYILGDVDKYIVMSLLNAYCGKDIKEYDIKTADTFAIQSKDTLQEVSKSLNYHVIKNQDDRNYVVAQFAEISVKTGIDVNSLMATIEDLNTYIETCFADVDFLTLSEYSIEEMKALSTMKEFRNMGIDVSETRLHLPYIIIK